MLPSPTPVSLTAQTISSKASRSEQPRQPTNTPTATSMTRRDSRSAPALDSVMLSPLSHHFQIMTPLYPPLVTATSNAAGNTRARNGGRCQFRCSGVLRRTPMSVGLCVICCLSGALASNRHPNRLVVFAYQAPVAFTGRTPRRVPRPATAVVGPYELQGANLRATKRHSELRCAYRGAGLRRPRRGRRQDRPIVDDHVGDGVEDPVGRQWRNPVIINSGSPRWRRPVVCAKGLRSTSVRRSSVRSSDHRINAHQASRYVSIGRWVHAASLD